MSAEAVSDLKSIPFEYHELIRNLEGRNSLRIGNPQPLLGGQTGAQVFLVSVSRAGEETQSLVLKLDRAISWSAEWQHEPQRLEAARRLAPDKFARQHLPELACQPIEQDGKIGVLYTIASNSLQRCRPARSYTRKDQLVQVFRSVGDGLLHEWNRERLTSESGIHPQSILESWLGYRLSVKDGYLYDFLVESCRVQPDAPGLLIDGQPFPNPYRFACDRDIWGSLRPLDVLRGFVHGDLNLGNLLVEFTHLGEELKGFFLIDFSHFTEAEYLFYDQAYFELSYLLSRAKNVPVSEWIAVIRELAEAPDEATRLGRVPVELATACEVIDSMRSRVSEWISERKISRDDLWGLYRLAGVAVGLNFCNKRNLTPEQRFASLLYAAGYLKSYCYWFSISEPETLEPVYFYQDPAFVRTGKHWAPFLEACHSFNPERLYILVVGPDMRADASMLATFGQVDWAIVLDFDPDTESGGLYSAVEGPLNRRRKVHLVTCDSDVSLNPPRSTYWYAAAGLRGRVATLVQGDHIQDWRRQYAHSIRQFLSEAADASGEQAVTCVILWNDPNYVAQVCDLISDAFPAPRCEFVFAVADPNPLEQVVANNRGKSFPVEARQISAGLARLLRGEENVPQQIYLPAKNEQVTIERETANYLEEEMTLIHLHIGASDKANRGASPSFLRGNTISWFELSLHQDVDRDKMRECRDQVMADLEKRNSTRVHLYHRPGAGGTTLARRIAWEAHKKYPTVLLHKVSETTLTRFTMLRRKTELPILAVVETTAEIQQDLIDALYPKVRREQIPIVFLLVSRRFQPVADDGRNPRQRVFYLPEQLDLDEANGFAAVYGREKPNKYQDLLELANNREKIRMRLPFFFGLTAFEEDFTRLDDYVRARLEDMAPPERKIMVYLALAYQYGHQSLPAPLLGAALSSEGRSNVWLTQALDPRRQSLLVQEAQEASVHWRPLHYLIASEVLKQALAPEDSSPELWRQRLSEWAIRFIEDMSRLKDPGTNKPSKQVLDLLKHVLVFRNNQDMSEERITPYTFARLIEDIPAREGKRRVLEALTVFFPDEDHFHAHKARYLGFERMYEEALEAINHAIRLAPRDGVHHHIRGIILRQMAQDLMGEVEKRVRRHEEINDGALIRIESLLDQAEDAFRQAREIVPTDEHPYVSQVQLITRSIEFQYKISGETDYSTFLVNTLPSRYAEKIETAAELLDEVKRLRAGELHVESRYIKECETQLHRVLGNYERVIRGWQAMLSRSDVYHPSVRRRIVYAYLSAKGGSWDMLTRAELDEILNLMSDNLDAEPSRDSNVRLWFQAARRVGRVDTDQAIENLQYWYGRSSSIEPLYYLYVLYVLKAIEGSQVSMEQAKRLIEESRHRGAHLPNRTSSHEWLGRGQGMARLIHYSRLGGWVRERDFWMNTELLERVTGRIAHIDRPEVGWIELDCGLIAFFVPGRSRSESETPFYKGQDENKRVDFFLGFSYDGLRAWSVKLQTS